MNVDGLPSGHRPVCPLLSFTSSATVSVVTEFVLFEITARSRAAASDTHAARKTHTLITRRRSTRSPVGQHAPKQIFIDFSHTIKVTEVMEKCREWLWTRNGKPETFFPHPSTEILTFAQPINRSCPDSSCLPAFPTPNSIGTLRSIVLVGKPGVEKTSRPHLELRIQPVIIGDTTCSVSLLTRTTSGSNFAIPRH
jgi:hypothetical protein